MEWNFGTKAKALPKGSFWDVFWPAWSQAMTVVNIQSGFRIFPVNFKAIRKAKFSSSLVINSKIICCDVVATFLRVELNFKQEIVCLFC